MRRRVVVGLVLLGLAWGCVGCGWHFLADKVDTGGTVNHAAVGDGAVAE